MFYTLHQECHSFDTLVLTFVFGVLRPRSISLYFFLDIIFCVFRPQGRHVRHKMSHLFQWFFCGCFLSTSSTHWCVVLRNV